MCGYIDPATPKDCFVVAIPQTKAIYHGFDTGNKHGLIIGPIPALPAPDCYKELIDPPAWEFPVPPSLANHPLYEWSCSMASLNGVHRVRKSLHGGMQLDYGDFTLCLGDFRPSDALAWTDSPGWLRVLSADVSKQSLEFYKNKSECTDNLRRMEGHIIVWSCQSDVVIQIEH